MQRSGDKTDESRLTFFNNFTFALKPSSISSFCPSRSSANLCPFGCMCGSLNGDERPEAGGVTPRRAERSRREPGARILGCVRVLYEPQFEETPPMGHNSGHSKKTWTPDGTCLLHVMVLPNRSNRIIANYFDVRNGITLTITNNTANIFCINKRREAK